MWLMQFPCSIFTFSVNLNWCTKIQKEWSNSLNGTHSKKRWFRSVSTLKTNIISLLKYYAKRMLVNWSVCLQIFSRFVKSTNVHVFQTIFYKLEYVNCQVVDMENFPVRVMNKRLLVPGLFVPFVGVNELNVIDCNSLIATWRTHSISCL